MKRFSYSTSSTLLAATAVIALSAGTAMAAAPRVASPTIGHQTQGLIGGSTTLYNQNSNFGYGIDSQNFSATDSIYDDAGADDFKVPAGTSWKIKEVDVTGVYYNGSGPASSENVIFYADAKGKPGTAISTLSNLSCTDTSGSFACKLGKTGPKLKGGTKGKRYWVSVVANCAFAGCGQWGWVENKTIQNDPATWENPANGFGTGCTTWGGTVAHCLGSSAYSGDFAFDLKGTAK